MTKWLGLFFLTISTYLVKSQNLVESPAKEVVEISSSEVLIDTSGKYTFEDISTGKYKFMPLSTTSSTNPIHNTIYWVRFRISSKSKQKMAIIQTARSNQVLMYIPLDSIHYEVQKSGFNYTFSERNVYHNEHIFIIPVLTGERDHYYIKIISGNNFGIYIAPYSIPTYTSKTFKEALYYGFFFGIIFLAVLYRDRKSVV